MDRFRIFLLALAIAAPVLWVAAIASAADDATLFARITVHESTWITHNGSNRNEARVLYATLAAVAEYNGWTLREAMQRYSPKATGVWRERVPARTCWVRALDPDMRRPPCWPRHLSWEGRHRRKWAARLAEARGILADPPTWDTVAPVPLAHWGAPGFVQNAERYGWVRVALVGVHNWYWCAPARQPECRAYRDAQTVL